MKRWLLKRSKIDTKQMALELGVRQATACVLANRGFSARKDALDFLYGRGEAFADAMQMKGMAEEIGRAHV